MGWRVTSVNAPRCEGAAAIAIVETDDGAIPVGGATTEEAARLGHLISAAPLLLTVCRELVSVSDWNHDEDHDARIAFETVARQARAAIAKATGETV